MPIVLAEGRQGDPPDVDAVDLDGAPVDVVEAGDEVGRGGLARPRRADEGDELPGLGLEVDVLEGERGGCPRERGRGRRQLPVGGRTRRDGSRLDQAGLDRLLGDRLDDGVGHRFVGRGSGRVRLPLRERLVRQRGRNGGRGIAEPDPVAGAPGRARPPGSRVTASGASTISGSRSRYSKIRSKSASAPWISTWTLSSWPSGKKSRLWSVVKATMSPTVGADGSPLMASTAGQPVHEGRGDAEDRADDHEEPAADHRLAELEPGEAPVQLLEAGGRGCLLAERLREEHARDAQGLLGHRGHVGQRLLGLAADLAAGPCRRGR